MCMSRQGLHHITKVDHNRSAQTQGNLLSGIITARSKQASCCCRVFAFTRLNAHSSRSHAIVMLTIIKRRRTLPGQEAGPLQKVRIGKLFMVDLAGSERLKKSLSTGVLPGAKGLDWLTIRLVDG